MQNGKNLTIEEATLFIKAFERQETARQIPLEELAIGQKLDLDLIKRFILAIDSHEQKANIDAVRIYLAKSTRSGLNKEHYDVVLVPVLKDGTDLHKIYDRDARAALPTLVGNALPCPNVCPDLAFFCK
jgi:hypothetical protein